MLSNPSSSIANRRQQHRRQNSTPVAFETPNVRPIPANIHNQRKILGHRRGMSLDQRPSFQGRQPNNTDFNLVPGPSPFPQDNHSVSIPTNQGQQHIQHPMQVTQLHRPAQPGPPQQQQDEQISSAHQFQISELQGLQGLQNSPQGQRSRPPTPQEQVSSPVSSPLVQTLQQAPALYPSEQQIKDLEAHIKSVYGSIGTVYVNIMPSPTVSPEKGGAIDQLDMTSLPTANLQNLNGINLDPPLGGFAMSSQPSSEQGHDASTCYSSPSGFSHRSPSTSPRQTIQHTFLEGVEELGMSNVMPQYGYSDAAQLLSSPLARELSQSSFLSVSHAHSSPRAMSIADLNLEGSIEDTGITSEEISQYISPQDPATHRWMCLFPECNKTFGRRENIRSHVQTHLGDRQFRCNHCGKCFVRQHDLKRHAKIHTGDKPYRCPCGGGFARQDALTRHRQRGMCIGGFPGVTRNAKARGRPRKNRPDMEDRVEKATRSRRAIAQVNYASSLSGASMSDSSAEGMSPFANEAIDELDPFDSSPLMEIQDTLSSDPFGLDEPTDGATLNGTVADHESPFELLDADVSGSSSIEDTTGGFGLELPDNQVDADADADANILFSLTNITNDDNGISLNNSVTQYNATGITSHEEVKRMVQTPPHSPQVKAPGSGSSTRSRTAAMSNKTYGLPVHDKSPSRHSADSTVSHAFTTPPTSPLMASADDSLSAFTSGANADPMAALDCDNASQLELGISMFGNPFGMSTGSGAGDMMKPSRMTWFEENPTSLF